jgi:hypothetical protein
LHAVAFEWFLGLLVNLEPVSYQVPIRELLMPRANR